MARRPATAADRRHEAMPEDAPRIAVDLPYSVEAFEKIRLGFVPRDMDDKWFVYYEQPWLHLHRSWTGLAMYQVRLEPAGDSYRAVEVIVNPHEKKFGRRMALREVRHVEKWIDYLLVSRTSGPGKVLDDGVADPN